MSERTQSQSQPALNFFPLAKPRQPQVTALHFIEESVAAGYSDIVIAAPTGIGKSGIGATAALWAGSFSLTGYVPGGYYLVTQKMLQDQLENDFARWHACFRAKGGSLKSSSEYPCPRFGSCLAGGLVSAKANSGKKCAHRSDKTCPYILAKRRFMLADVAVTNYPYLFTEHMALGKLEPRNLLVADECHTLEKQIISFVEVLINRETLDNWAPAARPVPRMECLEEFADWLQDPYLNQCKERLEMLGENIAAGDHVNKKMQDEFNRLKNHIGRLLYAINDMTHRADDWIFWQEMPIKEKEWQYTAKPLYADSFIPLLIEEMGGIRLYMSAYPGPKDVFCRNLGLNPRQTAWLELDSTFPVDNRLIHMTTVGSMSRRYLEQTLPKLFKMCETILEAHPHDKGIIHCNSYALGQHIYGFLKSTAMRSRVLFAAKAQERSTHFNLHRTSPDPTVILSPSMAEGFSFDDNLARFQIIAKCPFPCIGDRQVAAKMKLDQDWYTLQTVQTCIQAAGRIVRSDTDFGATYILDSDFIRLYRQNEKFFPKWWVDALRFYSM